MSNNDHPLKRNFFDSLTQRTVVFPVIIFLTSFLLLSLFSYKRIFSSSKNNHFAYLAESWLSGQLNMKNPPPHGNDWARVTKLTLKDNSILTGSWWHSRGKYTFRTLRGKFIKINPKNILKRDYYWYVSFPPLPALLMVPFVKIWHKAFNDVLFTLFFAALNPVILWFILVRLRKKNHIKRTDKEIISLLILMVFGTVYLFSAIRGEVWYTAHIIGISFLLLFFLSLLHNKYILSGLALGAGFLTRTPLLFASITVPLYLYSINGKLFHKKSFIPILKFSFPFALAIAIAMILNYLRFKNIFEFGHHYLQIRWRYRIEKYGLFSYEYLSRNLSVALTLLPRIKFSYPYIQISPHGLALWITTPLFLTLLRFRGRHKLLIPLLIPTLFMFLLVLLYQNSGFVQFGYRFSLDFTPFLILLLAINKTKFGKLYYLLLFWGIIINIFGAITFTRFYQFYPHGTFIFFTS